MQRALLLLLALRVTASCSGRGHEPASSRAGEPMRAAFQDQNWQDSTHAKP